MLVAVTGDPPPPREPVNVLGAADSLRPRAAESCGRMAVGGDTWLMAVLQGREPVITRGTAVEVTPTRRCCGGR